MRLSKLFARLLILVLVASVAGGCTINRNIMFRTPTDFAFDPFNPISDVNYRIAPNDLISFQLYSNKGERLLLMTAGSTAAGLQGQGGGGMNQNMLNQNNRFTYEVRPDGTVDLPELGVVKLAGLNIDEAETYLEEAFSENYVNPLALIEVTNQRVLVFPGEAGVASVVPLVNPNTSLLEVLALSGGIRARGDARNVKLIRRSQEGQTVHLLDLSTIEGLKFANTTVQAGDIVYVEPLPQYAQEVLADIGPVLSLLTTISSFLALISVINGN
ncbi:MAG: polysaccharide biosynthesis/export family protein [Flavobacteriales bacterium]|nr:polysaccharide biosynthesis/export family protein [Flavobacteriales bacterium]